MNLSAYIPCFNNEATVAQAVSAIRQQTVPVDELFVIDDGSSDRSVEVVKRLGVRVIVHERNLGRGAARARAMLEARHELVLGCDASKALAPDFLARALPWMEQPDVAALFGRVIQAAPGNGIERWRNRHLFKTESPVGVQRQASLATGGVLLRKSLVLQAGNFDARLPASEDAELGRRLLARGHEVVFDPALTMSPLGRNTLGQVMERYCRWNLDPACRFNFGSYLRQISYSIKVMAREDLRQNDFTAAVISLLCPHFLFWQANVRPLGGRR